MTRAWLCGWSVDCFAFARLCERARPAERALVFPATRSGLLALQWSGCQAFGGYSLGANLLLTHSAERAGFCQPGADVLLLAPFLAYPAERGLGGRIRRSQLELVRRALERDPRAAVADFHRRAGLEGLAEADPDVAALQEGLRLLSADGLSMLPVQARGWRFVLGAQDPLLDPCLLLQHFPAENTRLLPEVGHEPSRLLAFERGGTRAF